MLAHQCRVLRNLFLPLFSHMSDHIRKYEVWADKYDEGILASRLLAYLSAAGEIRWTRTDYYPCDWQVKCSFIQTLPFFWTFMDVDVDMEQWQDRYPLLPVCEYIIRQTIQGTLHRASRPAWCVRDISPTLVRALRIGMLEAHVAPPCPLETLWCPRESDEMGIVKRLRAWHLRTRWCATCCLTVSGMAFASELVTQYSYGNWLDLLQVAEESTSALLTVGKHLPIY